MSESNRVAIRISPETVLGTTDANPVFEELRLTAAPDLAFAPQTTESAELKSNRKTTSLPLVGAAAGGSINHELSFGSLDTLLEAAMFGTWNRTAFRDNDGTADSNITAVASTAITVLAGTKPFAEGMMVQTTGFASAANNKTFRAASGSGNTSIAGTGFTVEAAPAAAALAKQVGFQGTSGDLALSVTGSNKLTSTTLDFTTLNLAAGHWVKVGNGTAANSFATTGLTLGFFARVLSVTANEVIFDRVPVAFAADSGTSKTITVGQADVLTEGVTKRSFTVEEEFGDVANLYQYLEGMVPESMDLSFDTQAIVGVTSTFQGTNAFFKKDGRISGSTTVAAPTTAVLNTSSNVPRIGEGGSEVVTPNIVLSGGLTINNNLRQINGVGRIGAYDIGAGRSVITGNLATIFGNADLAEKVINNTASSFDVVFENTSEGNAILFDCPNVRYSDGAPEVPGSDEDVTVPLTFQALEDATLGYQLAIQRFHKTT